MKTKVIAFHGADFVRAKIVVDDIVLEEVSDFKYLDYNVSYITSNDVVNDLDKFTICGTIRRTVKSMNKETQLKFYKACRPHISLWV